MRSASGQELEEARRRADGSHSADRTSPHLGRLRMRHTSSPCADPIQWRVRCAGRCLHAGRGGHFDSSTPFPRGVGSLR